MPALERAIAALKQEIEGFPRTALLRTDGTQFDFGRACGYQQGLLKALDLLEQAMADDDRSSKFSQKTATRL